MDIRIKATEYEMTSEASAYLDERLKAVEKHLGDAAKHTRCEVELGKSSGHSQHGEHWFTEIQLLIPGEDLKRVVGKGETLNESIDKVKDEILRTIKKDHSKKVSHVRKIGAKIKEWLRGEGK